MGFTSYEFLVFFPVFLALYWLGKNRNWKNLLLLIASYIFYGWIASWHVAVIFLSTLIDYLLALGMARWKNKSTLLMWIGIILNVSLLLFTKYYFFINASLAGWLNQIGLGGDIFLMRIVLPLGLSFYILKKIGYLLDVQRGTFKPTRDFIAFAAYVSFFPQVLSGPIDRPQKLLAQLLEPRAWKSENLYNAWQLLVMGFFKKLVIANTVQVIVEQIFELAEPSKILLIVGGLGFALQILADFSSYTDLSRGFAYLLGLETTENFNQPYLSLTPGEFWNRWHISLSSWLRDYIFFPIRRVLLKRKDVIPDVLIQSIPPLVTMFVSGLWHGVGWKFIVWGLYYGVLIVIYQLLGIRGDPSAALRAGWNLKSAIKQFLTWLVMFSLIVFGWLIFRTVSLEWLWNAVIHSPFYRNSNELIASFVLLVMIGFYALLLIVKSLLDRYFENYPTLHAVYFVAATLITIVFINSSSPDFIYFQF
jgi:D-alanyl-lipoteichoic acid acyltransferase DltB (MBOAT superfamily)